jgi:signal transduction histidine kinase
MSAVVVCFLAALWTAQRHMDAMEQELAIIESVLEPNVVQLERVQAEVDRASLESEEYSLARTSGLPTAMSIRAKALSSRAAGDRALEGYAHTPFLPGEEELYGELRRALQSYDSSFRAVIDGPPDVAETDREAMTRAEHENANQIDKMIDRIVDYDRLHAQNRLAALRGRRERGAATATLLGGASLALATVATLLAWRAILGEARRQHALERERESRAAAEEAVRSRDEFLSLISHELRTPLTSLRLAIQSLRRSPKRGEGMLEMAERQTLRMNNLVDELLDVAQIHVGHVTVTLEEVDLSAVVKDAIASRATEIEHAGVSVTTQVAPPVVGQWDRGHIEHIVANLLSNALKFGMGKPIEVLTARVGDRARLVFQDHGIGIPAERLPFVFDVFSRAVSSRHYAGLGTGLYVVRALTEALGGSVDVESIENAGSTFTVDLPLDGPPTSHPQHG